MEKNIEQQIPSARELLLPALKHAFGMVAIADGDNAVLQAMEEYASLKVEEERKKLEEKITFWTLEWNKEELKTKEQQSRIEELEKENERIKQTIYNSDTFKAYELSQSRVEELTNALEDLRSTYSESISFDDKKRIDKLLNSKSLNK